MIQWPPNYLAIWQWRQTHLIALKEKPSLASAAWHYYQRTPIAFINHWIDTYDPRNAGTGTPAHLPFVLFSRQIDLVRALHVMWKEQQCLLIEKCRDTGITNVCCAFSVWLWMFHDGASIGWGSRKEQLVHRSGDMDSIFEKLKCMIRRIPKALRPIDYDETQHSAHMRIMNPENGNTITGEAGDSIGRGGRKTIYFVDEAAHLERPEKVEAALADNSPVRIYLSSVNGTGNPFHRKRLAGMEYTGGKAHRSATNVLVMDWRHDPRKSEAWYQERRHKAEQEGLLHLFLQEVDRRYDAAMEGVIIPSHWVDAAVDAHKTLGFDESGACIAGFDVADQGIDLNALAIRKGVVIYHVDQWGDVDVGSATRKAIGMLPAKLASVQYDCIGVGAGVKSEANRLRSENLISPKLQWVPWNAGSEVHQPDGFVIPGDRESPTNKDFFQNLKAQAWWSLRRRFEQTYRAVAEKQSFHPEELISINSKIPLLQSLKFELSQPCFKKSASLKLMVDKTPDGTRSPNMADAVMMAFWPCNLHVYTLENL